MAKLDVLLTLGRLPTAARLDLLRTLRARAEARGLDTARVDEAIAGDEALQALEARWDASQERGEAKELDDAIDAALEALDTALEDAGEPASALRTALFPQGVEHHTNLPFQEQLGANQRVLDTLSQDVYQDVVSAHDLGAHAEALRPLQQRFAAMMDTSEGVQFAEVRDARAAARERFARTALALLAPHLDDEEALDDLADPMIQAVRGLERAARRLRRKQRGR
jgi:hypothetical protein